MVFYARFSNYWNRIEVCYRFLRWTVTNHIAFQQWVISSTQEREIVWNEILPWIHNEVFVAFNMLLGGILLSGIVVCLAYFAL